MEGENEEMEEGEKRNEEREGRRNTEGATGGAEAARGESIFAAVCAGGGEQERGPQSWSEHFVCLFVFFGFLSQGLPTYLSYTGLKLQEILLPLLPDC